jgi:hypothetical protein
MTNPRAVRTKRIQRKILRQEHEGWAVATSGNHPTFVGWGLVSQEGRFFDPPWYLSALRQFRIALFTNRIFARTASHAAKSPYTDTKVVRVRIIIEEIANAK